MPATRAQRKPHVPTTAEQHAEWLGLLRPDGPFLALPVLAETFSDGLDTVPAATRDRIRQAWAEVSAEPDLLGPQWQQLIIDEVLRYQPSLLATPAGEFGALRPDAVLLAPGKGGGPRLHLYRRSGQEPLTKAVDGRPALIERAAQVCRDTRVPLALLTNGRLWVLVHAKHGEATSTAVFDADIWFDEPLLLRAFATLLAATRVLPPATGPDGEPTASLAGLFARSAAAQANITTTLGNQVRQAVELFVGELARLDREAGGALLAEASEREIYRGALTVLMRLVFLLYAEEQRLLPVTDPLYASAYAVSTLYDQLEADRNLHGDEVGDRRAAAWPRLLAVFAAIYGGCEHPDLRIPPYGGSLFDSSPYPWLLRAAVTDRVIHEVLDALVVLRHRGRAAERLSYAGLDVEQIGHVYEGLLEFSCRRVKEPYVGLIGKLEPELPLAELEANGEDDAWLRAQCDLTAKQLEKALAAQPDQSALGDLGAACDNDSALAERVRPYWGLLRTDLRGYPTVFPAGSVLFTQVGDRRSTGTHYTPRSLAEEIVQHTLAPLCYAPGPAEGLERGTWRAKTADELLQLKIVDPAMGSGAFLVAACRYLSERVVEAWERDGVPDRVAALLNSSADRDGLLLAARRMVAGRCLYGVDRDDMAVELAKLSLWLVTLAKNKPFGFLDHSLRCGDSLVGLLSPDQLVSFHLVPERGRQINNRVFSVIDEDIDAVLSRATKLRLSIEETVVEHIDEAQEKAEKLAEVERLTARLRLTADAVVGAALSTAGQSSDVYDDRLTSVSDEVADFLKAHESPAERGLRETIAKWLRGERQQPIRPLHWPLEFPEVMGQGGFDAVVGNPPFIGGKRVSGAVGKDVREYLKQRIARDKPGNADLCSYFLLRNLDIVWRGRVGIIATNTIAQGDTREVGLDQAVQAGWSVYRAVKSQPWPGTASLEVSLLWVGHMGDDETPTLGGRPVAAITPSLDPKSRESGNPYRLASNADQSFQGCIVLGMGFVLEPEHADELLDKDPRNGDVLFPYLNGEDLNSRSDCSASRWVIDFNDWPIEKAMEYPDVFLIVDRKVRPERQRVKPDGSYILRKPLPQRWWQYADKRPALRAAIASLDRVLVIARVSRTAIATFVPTGQVLNEKVVVFASNRTDLLALINSELHVQWAWRYSATLKTDLQYTPTDCFETFPQPELTKRMDQVGAELDTFRRGVMQRRQLGLTKLYNLVHDPAETDEEIQRLREIHAEIDNATAEAYGWTDLDLGHGFHMTRQGRRFTIAPDVQVEVLDRLLELNHKRYQEEVDQGLHTKKGRAKARKQLKELPILEDGLFPPEGALF